MEPGGGLWGGRGGHWYALWGPRGPGWERVLHAEDNENRNDPGRPPGVTADTTGATAPEAETAAVETPPGATPDGAAAPSPPPAGKAESGKSPRPRPQHQPPPASLRIMVRVLIAAWLVLGALLALAYLYHPAGTPKAASTATANSGSTLPAPDPLIPVD